MNYLYQNEEIEFYDPITDGHNKPQVIVDDVEKYERRGAAVQELLQSAGWELLKEQIDSEILKYQKNLEEVHELPAIYRLQAGIKVLRGIESFLNSCLWEARVATENRESGPNQGDDE